MVKPQTITGSTKKNTMMMLACMDAVYGLPRRLAIESKKYRLQKLMMNAMSKFA